MSSTPAAAAASPLADALLVEVDADVSLPRRRLRLHGELDLATAPLLASALDAQAAGCQQLELDLGGLVFCDLVGLTALEHAQQRLRDRGCQMTVYGIHGQLRRLLEIEGLRSALSAAPSRPPVTAILTRPRPTLASLVAGLVRHR